MHGLRETAAASSSVDPTSRLVRGGLSHVIGDTSEPLSELTVDGMFCETVRRTPDRLALSSPAQSIRYSWNELEEQVATAAAGLLSIGVGSGDRVGCWLPNVAEYVVMQLATSRIGAILTCLNPAYKLAELQHALRLAGVKALLFCPGGARSDHTAVVERLLQTAEEAAPCLERVVSAVGHSLQHPMAMAYADVLEGGKRSRDQGLAAASLRGDGLEERSRAPAAAPALSHEDVTNIQFTSGTTGLPKAVGLTHRNIVNNGRFVARGMRLTSDDAVCLPVPLFHCFGLVLGSLACISTGAAIVFPSRTFDPRAALQAVQEERCSALYGVPTIHVHDTSTTRPTGSFDLSSLRTGIMAGSLCPVSTMARVRGDMHMADLTVCYGMTETSPVSFQSVPASLSGGRFDAQKLCSTVGHVHPHVECKVVCPESGQTLPVGEQGELLTRGYSVMGGGYWGDEAATREDPLPSKEVMTADGFLRTGDLATIDAQGYCTISGRRKDVIIRGGENIAPMEVEEVILRRERRLRRRRTGAFSELSRSPPRHEDVYDVAVVGVDDATYGEQVALLLQTHDPTDPATTAVIESIEALCRTELAHFKVPKFFRVVDRFPLTASGKVQKFVLKEESSEALRGT
ncbi:putative long-chain-fatty-acid-CoA ligase [Emiliania huxleyi CCMP1516]|uniref:Uncharacterized protein n=2 Tax=Emiliania huxleyi TaxID=2903 RepID=A0A0D3K183_EMIH1|nr:putative long-chain-fatty-acid-CoA ligase [Emiliania huxleyi CCMP1516]EOD29518.1 putative long-chain-fatty-acid-CoA ligase [Emiliania huxleyi CCMP1516]|eukprot:XP_005781947.1 putative long-chain-fatty-acid-CoA ligase [Emiliania huxleyi CCMP1516]